MELQQIRYFLAVAETQHVTRTAERLHVAQPALTQSIHRLEKELEVPLFIRRGRGILLTEYGKALREKIAPLMQELDRIPEELRAIHREEVRTLRLNVLAASSMIISAVIAYKKKNPDIRFQIIQKSEIQDCDIEISTKMFYQSDPERENEFVCSERIFLAVPNAAPYAGRKKIRLAEVASEGFIVLSGSRMFRSICDRFCHHALFQPKVIFESDSPSAVRNMIAANIGVGFWPEFAWGKLRGDDVLLLEIEEPLCARDLIFTRCSGRPASDAADDFFRFLYQYTRRMKKTSV